MKRKRYKSMYFMYTDTASFGAFRVGTSETSKIQVFRGRKWVKIKPAWVVGGVYQQYVVSWSRTIGWHFTCLDKDEFVKGLPGKPKVYKIGNPVSMAEGWYVMDDYYSYKDKDQGSFFYKYKPGSTTAIFDDMNADGIYRVVFNKGAFGVQTAPLISDYAGSHFLRNRKIEEAEEVVRGLVDVPGEIKSEDVVNAAKKCTETGKPSEHFWKIWRVYKFLLRDNGVKVRKIGAEFFVEFLDKKNTK